MPDKIPASMLASGVPYWDYTTLPRELQEEAARLSVDGLLGLRRDGFDVRIYDTPQEFFLAEAMEYVTAWQASTADNPKGICGPIGPTEQLPLVAQLVNTLGISVRDGHFWGMDEWFSDGKEVPVTHPLSFERADRELCFNRIDPKLCMPDEHLHFPAGDTAPYTASWDAGVECVLMQGGQGETKHWAFNDPPRRQRPYDKQPMPVEEFRKLGTRVVDLHPATLTQNARTSGGGFVAGVPTQAITVGPVETWKAKRVSIWHPGWHDNAFGIRLTALMISKGMPNTCVPMSLLADHQDVVFNYLRPGIGECTVEMH